MPSAPLQSPSEAPPDGLQLDFRSPNWGTWLLAAVLVAVHVWTAVAEYQIGLEDLTTGLFFERDLRFRVSAGGQYASMVDRGEVWRLWTSMLLHADALHLTVNLLGLLALGRLFEPWIGPVRLLAWFTFGGFSGSLASHVAGVVQSDGASGGLFALLGAGIVLGVEHRSRLPPADARLVGPVLWGLLALNLVLSFALPFVDAVGHLGGLFVGLMLGGAIGRSRHRGVSVVEWVWLLLCIVAWGIGWMIDW